MSLPANSLLDENGQVLGTNKVYIQNEEPSTPKEGDLWIYKINNINLINDDPENWSFVNGAYIDSGGYINIPSGSTFPLRSASIAYNFVKNTSYTIAIGDSINNNFNVNGLVGFTGSTTDGFKGTYTPSNNPISASFLLSSSSLEVKFKNVAIFRTSDIDTSLTAKQLIAKYALTSNFFKSYAETKWTDVQISSHSHSEYLKLVSPPLSATSAGAMNQIAYDDNYFYICAATNTWIRFAKTAW